MPILRGKKMRIQRSIRVCLTILCVLFRVGFARGHERIGTFSLSPASSIREDQYVNDFNAILNQDSEILAGHPEFSEGLVIISRMQNRLKSLSTLERDILRHNERLNAFLMLRRQTYLMKEMGEQEIRKQILSLLHDCGTEIDSILWEISVCSSVMNETDVRFMMMPKQQETDSHLETYMRRCGLMLLNRLRQAQGNEEQRVRNLFTGFAKELLPLRSDINRFIHYLKQYEQVNEFQEQARAAIGPYANVGRPNETAVIFFIPTDMELVWMFLGRTLGHLPLGIHSLLTDDVGSITHLIVIRGDIHQGPQLLLALAHEVGHAQRHPGVYMRPKQPFLHIIDEGYQNKVESHILDSVVNNDSNFGPIVKRLVNEVYEQAVKKTDISPEDRLVADVLGITEARDWPVRLQYFVNYNVETTSYPLEAKFVRRLIRHLGDDEEALKMYYQANSIDLLRDRLGERRFNALSIFFRTWARSEALSQLRGTGFPEIAFDIASETILSSDTPSDIITGSFVMALDEILKKVPQETRRKVLTRDSERLVILAKAFIQEGNIDKAKIRSEINALVSVHTLRTFIVEKAVPLLGELIPRAYPKESSDQIARTLLQDFQRVFPDTPQEVLSAVEQLLNEKPVDNEYPSGMGNDWFYRLEEFLNIEFFLPRGHFVCMWQDNSIVASQVITHIHEEYIGRPVDQVVLTPYWSSIPSWTNTKGSPVSEILGGRVGQQSRFVILMGTESAWTREAEKYYVYLTESIEDFRHRWDGVLPNLAEHLSFEPSRYAVWIPELFQILQERTTLLKAQEPQSVLKAYLPDRVLREEYQHRKDRILIHYAGSLEALFYADFLQLLKSWKGMYEVALIESSALLQLLADPAMEYPTVALAEYLWDFSKSIPYDSYPMLVARRKATQVCLEAMVRYFSASSFERSVEQFLQYLRESPNAEMALRALAERVSERMLRFKARQDDIDIAIGQYL